MWVCYFTNVGIDSCIYRYKVDHLSPTYVNEKKSYNIDSVEIDSKTFHPIKIYQQSENDLICFVSCDKENFDFLNENKYSSPLIEIPLKFCPDSEEETDSRYSEEGYPLCDSTHYQAIKDLSNSLRQSGIKVVGYEHSYENHFLIKISAQTLQSCVADAEYSRFFASSVFRNVLGKFILSRKKSNNYMKISFQSKENIEVRENLKYVKKINHRDDRVEITFDKPDLTILSTLIEVLSLNKT